MNTNEQTQALTTHNQQAIQEHEHEPRPEKDLVRVAKAESINLLLSEGYKRASTLELTHEESEKLGADFPDDAFRLGAGGDMNLLYLEHAYLRKRLNDVLGLGSVVSVRRREWAEEFDYYKDRVKKTGVRVYADCVLLIRGCFVGEAVGDMTYYPDNGKQTYSDALEGAESNAFRRCAKELGVGLQAWMKGFSEQWKERNSKGSSRSRPQGHTSATTSSREPEQENPSEPQEGLSIDNWRAVKVHFGKNKDTDLGNLSPKTLQWYAEVWKPEGPNGSKPSAKDIQLQTAARLGWQETVEAMERES